MSFLRGLDALKIDCYILSVTTLAALRSAVTGASPKIVKVSGIITGGGLLSSADSVLHSYGAFAFRRW
jgi:hypothetical protein